MSPLREAVLLQMRLRGFSPQTVESYIHAMEELARFYQRALDTLSCRQVQWFLDRLIRIRKLAWATINVYFSAYRFLYEQTLKRPIHQFSIPPRGRSGTRPGILSNDEVLRVIEAPRQLKHRALLTMTYGSGLRVSEAVRIRICDIDRGRMSVFVEGGKGHKDRYTILSQRALQLLEDLWRTEHPPEYFFFGRQKDQPMAVGTAQAIYYQALTRSGVRKVGGIHVLRHCFATHLMEAKVDIYTIKRWMGHRALATTGRYMHVTSEHLRKIVSPLDMLSGKG